MRIPVNHQQQNAHKHQAPHRNGRNTSHHFFGSSHLLHLHLFLLNFKIGPHVGHLRHRFHVNETVAQMQVLVLIVVGLFVVTHCCVDLHQLLVGVSHSFRIVIF